VSGNHRHFGGHGTHPPSGLFSCAGCLIARVIISVRAILFCGLPDESHTHHNWHRRCARHSSARYRIPIVQRFFRTIEMISNSQRQKRKTALRCHFLYPRSLKSLDLFCLSSSLSIARDERPSTTPMTERLVSAFATITCTGLLVAQ
jgi:hypothetical protein